MVPLILNPEDWVSDDTTNYKVVIIESNTSQLGNIRELNTRLIPKTPILSLNLLSSECFL